MAGSFTRFRIEGLHNTRTIDIPIVKNKLVLVGENGTGKSTIANLIYSFLTCQWSRMLNYEFKTILAVLDDEEIRITKDDISSLRISRHFLTKLPIRYRVFAEEVLMNYPLNEIISNPEVLAQVNRRSIPRAFLHDYVENVTEEGSFSSEYLEKAVNKIRNSINEQIP